MKLDYRRGKKFDSDIKREDRHRVFRCLGLIIVWRIIGLDEPTCSRELVTALVPWRIVHGVSELLRNIPDVIRERNNFPPPVAYNFPISVCR